MKDTRIYLAAVGLRESLQDSNDARALARVWSTNTKLLTKENVSLINYEQKVEHFAVVM